MRTTLDIEDDVLQAAKELALKEKTTAGAIVSRLARAGLCKPLKRNTSARLKNGIPVFPARSREIVTLENIQKIMDEEEI